MPTSYISLSCDAYKKYLFTGFSRLQEQQEFVDLTLAAEGHLVKVHKNIIALASPYLKGMIQSASSQNPVIFLNNVSHKVLTYLLEYIYQGEVHIPEHSVESFMEVSKSLHLIGLTGSSLFKPKSSTNVTLTQNSTLHSTESESLPRVQTCDTFHELNEYQQAYVNSINDGAIVLKPEIENTIKSIDATNMNMNLIQSDIAIPREATLNTDINAIQSEHENENTVNVSTKTERPSNFAACITIKSNHSIDVQQFSDNVPICHLDQIAKGAEDIKTVPDSMPIIEDLIDEPMISDDMELNSLQHGQNINNTPQICVPTVNTSEKLLGLVPSISLDQETRDALKTISKYSVTQRGALQIIINRYIYSCHHTSRGGRKRRWRCIDYRALHCPAYVDSFDGRIVLRKGIHKHAFHDDIIQKKEKRRKIYYTVDEAAEAKNLPDLKEEASDDDEVVVF